jgi:cystathionine gamma-synthase/methionine-gamma-lyase
METIANPLLRVPALDKIAQMARAANVPLIVDNTFATPLLVRPLEFGAAMTVHSLTKYLSGHGDVMGGIVVADADHVAPLRNLARTVGFLLGPFESYLAMRGIKTFPLRMERHCANACKVASWLASHPAVERVNFPSDPKHPDADNIRRVFAPGLYGGMVSFEVKGADRAAIFQFMNALRMIVPGTSLGDVHSLMLYPAMASHRDLSPKHRERLGIRDNLVRLSVGIEDTEDITADLDQALRLHV